MQHAAHGPLSDLGLLNFSRLLPLTYIRYMYMCMCMCMHLPWSLARACESIAPTTSAILPSSSLEGSRAAIG